MSFSIWLLFGPGKAVFTIGFDGSDGKYGVVVVAAEASHLLAERGRGEQRREALTHEALPPNLTADIIAKYSAKLFLLRKGSSLR